MTAWYQARYRQRGGRFASYRQQPVGQFFPDRFRPAALCLLPGHRRRRAFAVGAFNEGTNFLDQDIETWDEGGGEDSGHRHAEEHHGTDAALAGRTSTTSGQQWNHSKDERQTRHQHRTEPQVGSFDRSFDCWFAIFFFQFLGKFDDENRALRREPNQQDSGLLRIQVQLAPWCQ